MLFYHPITFQVPPEDYWLAPNAEEVPLAGSGSRKERLDTVGKQKSGTLCPAWQT